MQRNQTKFLWQDEWHFPVFTTDGSLKTVTALHMCRNTESLPSRVRAVMTRLFECGNLLFQQWPHTIHLVLMCYEQVQCNIITTTTTTTTTTNNNNNSLRITGYFCFVGDENERLAVISGVVTPPPPLLLPRGAEGTKRTEY
jgi:hypothetical protein